LFFFFVIIIFLVEKKGNEILNLTCVSL